jgi:RNA polymerase sigma-70 factor (ECF subfamily)
VSTDAEYIQMVRRGDPAGAEALFRRHAGAIMRFATRMTGSHHEAEEICQDAFVKMIDHADQFDGRAPLASWLLSIAANTCRDHLRRRRRTSTLPLTAAGPLEAKAPSALNVLVEHETRAEVKEALGMLSEDQREVVLLARYHGQPYDQIARTLGITEGAVKTRMFRAMEILKARFAKPEAAAARATKEDEPWIAAKP